MFLDQAVSLHEISDFDTLVPSPRLQHSHPTARGWSSGSRLHEESRNGNINVKYNELVMN